MVLFSSPKSFSDRFLQLVLKVILAPMLSARIHEYKKPLEIEDVQMPLITSGEEVIVRVAASGLCHSDFYIINGDLKDIIPLNLPSTPGHEIAGWI
jgi:alcohol dehydrogenase, propanol-preferring